jgi:hypothetical protein
MPTEHWKAEVIRNGPRGQARAELHVEQDGCIMPYSADEGMAQANNIYNDLPEPGVCSRREIGA